MNKLHNDTFLYDHVVPGLHRLIEDGLFFAPWTGDVSKKLRNNSDGSRTWEITGMSGSIVERVSGMWEDGADTAVMALIKGLEEAPLFGNADYEGTGERLRYMWRKLWVNQIGKVVDKEAGLLNLLRTKKIEKESSQALIELVKFMRKWKNVEFISTFYEGNSFATTIGTDDAPEGIGANKVLHPNLYCNEVDPTNGGSLQEIGTEGKNTLASELDTALTTNYADLEYPSSKFLDKMGEKIDELGIQKRASYKGVPKWLVGTTRNAFNKLKQDDDIRDDIRSAFMSKEYDNPLFGHEAKVIDEYLFVIDKKQARSWDDSTNDFAGTNGYWGNPTYYSTNAHSFMNVYGENALGYSNAFPTSMIPDNTNYTLIKTILAVCVMGIGRGEWVDKSLESTYFVSGNETSAYLGSAIEVTNQTSAGFAVKTD